MDQPYPILEHDPTTPAMIEPSRVLQPLENCPERWVLCFFQKVIADVAKTAPLLLNVNSEIGPNPIYVLHTETEPVAVMHPGVGGPLAAAFLEEAIALGGRKFIACGGSGVLDNQIGVGHVVVPTSAIRDEGVSYHYLPPAREVPANPAAIEAIEATLQKHGVPYRTAKTWTTDAVYRETPARIARRKAEGCAVVEMEAAAFFAVAQFRGVVFGQVIYGGDDISGETWDSRGWIHGQTSTREKLFWLAVEAVLRL
jgi:uridine phosphorylase